MSGPVPATVPAPQGRGHQARRRTVSKPHDASEREADCAADVVGRGGSVASWSFASAPLADAGGVHRQETGKPPTEEEKYKEAATKVGEAALDTKEGKALKDKVLADPLVKTLKDAATSPAGIATIIGVGAVGVGGLAATGKELPIQPPKIPLGFITPGLSAKVTWKGPVNAPTEGGIVLTYTEQGPKGSEKRAADRQHAQWAREAAELRAFQSGLTYQPGTKEAEQERQTQEAIARAVSKNANLPGLFLPFDPSKKPEAAPPQEKPAGPEDKKPDDAPVQREPASTSTDRPAGPEATPQVDDALASPGRPLDASTRRFMEARFGVDFSAVRIHDDTRAAEGTRGIDAAAFTVGHDVVFGPGRFDPNTPAGRHLLGHELAHVVQQSRAGAGRALQRRSIFESIGILLGLSEGTWEDRELLAYLRVITTTRKIEGSYDSDNKARAIVARWKASSPSFDISGAQKILLIEEMLDGPTLVDDETAIVDLLELSDAADQVQMLGAHGVRLDRIEADIDDKDQRARLDTFINSRFDGGRNAVLSGKLTVVGPNASTKAPTFGFSAAGLDARFDSARTAEDLIALLAGYSYKDRTDALHHLVAVRRPAQLREQGAIRAEAVKENESASPDKAKLDALKVRFAAQRDRQLKTERVILHFLRDSIPATKEDLANNTSATDPARQGELREALKPAVRRTASGAAEKFRAILPGEVTTYQEKLEAALPKLVDTLYKDTVVGKGKKEHDDPAKAHTLTEFERIGKRAKTETDAVFGRFKKGDELVADKPRRRGNVRDQFTETANDLKRMKPEQRKAMARKLCHYIFSTSGAVRRLNHDHNASPEFDDKRVPKNDEAIAQTTVADAFVDVATNVVRLNEIDRGWPAAALPKKKLIFFQLFRDPDPEKDRLLLWDVFQTFIHEYLHTLAADRYRTYAGTFGDDSAQENTLVEGLDSVLTEIVWDAVEPKVNDQDLRDAVEGSESTKPPLPKIPHPGLTQRYPSYTEALQLVDKVGIQNLYAAYFLGLIDRIGGTP